MRLADAAHVDLGSFYARQPGLGRIYRLAGYVACLAVLWQAHSPRNIATLLVVLLVAWLMAWKREVGAVFRAPLVAAILMCAVLLTAARLGHPLQGAAPPSPAPATAPADGRRPIEIRYHDGPPPEQPGVRP
jgi:hypothetical protein